MIFCHLLFFRFVHYAFTSSGRLFIIGGYGDDDDSRSQVDIVELRPGTITQACSMGWGRWGHSAASTAETVFVFGGFRGEYLSSCEIYDIEDDTYVSKK